MKRHAVKYYSKGTLRPGAEGFGRHNHKKEVKATDTGETFTIGSCLALLIILAVLSFIQFLKLIL